MRVKCASFIRQCYCLSIIKHPAVSLLHFDTIVEKGMLWESPEIKIVPFIWSHFNALLSVLNFDWDSRNINYTHFQIRLFFMRMLLSCFLLSCLTFRSVWRQACLEFLSLSNIVWQKKLKQLLSDLIALTTLLHCNSWWV